MVQFRAKDKHGSYMNMSAVVKIIYLRKLHVKSLKHCVQNKK